MKKDKVVNIPLNIEPTEEERKAVRERLNAKQLTQWLTVTGKCGPTSYDTNTNLGWCNCEVERLKGKKIKAAVITHDGFCAVFRLDSTETAADISKMIEIAKVDVNAE